MAVCSVCGVPDEKRNFPFVDNDPVEGEMILCEHCYLPLGGYDPACPECGGPTDLDSRGRLNLCWDCLPIGKKP